jgi:hypothetical protein
VALAKVGKRGGRNSKGCEELKLRNCRPQLLEEFQEASKL